MRVYKQRKPSILTPLFSIMRHHPRIPESATLVFRWIRSHIYQWQQELYDGSQTLFERIRFIDGAFVIAITSDEKIIITRQEQPAREPFLGLPWGGIEEDEDPLTCAKRELREETGYMSDDWSLWKESEGWSNLLSYTYFFIARNCYKVSEGTNDPWEKIVLDFLTFDEFLMLTQEPTFRHHSDILPDLYEARLSRTRYMHLRDIFFWNE